ncbi:hypothetical protein G9P44_002116 [Scheffersomyces stipitis]|nr:hypothetical protein G9P44_002116 [Scheffersomyces stipitis]
MTQQSEELDQIKSKIQEHLISSGNYDIINKQLKLQLYESGWFDKVSQLASRELSDKSDQNFDQLYSFVKPRAEQLVPAKVKEDILEKIKDYLEEIIQ